MPVYRLSKQHRAEILNVSVDTHDKAQALILAMKSRGEPLSWYDALRIIDANTSQHPLLPTNIVDNGHHDHGAFHTITVSRNVAKLLTEQLNVELTFHHDLHHVPPETSSK